MPKTSTSGQGRKKGVPNKIPNDVKLLAQSFGPAAIEKLAELAGLLPKKEAASNEQTRVAAIKELLDRGYGKSAQPIIGDALAPLVHRIERVIIDPKD